MQPHLLVINADDFGKDHRVNQAVMEGFRKGLCSSATLMPNMPGFEEACQLVHEYKLAYHIGLHLVLRDGFPLTDRIKRFPRLCDREGRLCLSRSSGKLPILSLESAEREVLAEEIRAQIQRCRGHGIPLTHVDSHYHLHNEWAILSVLIPILHEHRIQFLRIARNCGLGLNLSKRAYKRFVNRRIRHEKLDRTQYLGSVNDYADLKRRLSPNTAVDSFEVIVHPTLGGDGSSVIDDDTRRPLEETIQAVDPYPEAVSYLWHRYHP